MKKPVCVVIGVGPGNGMACAERFAKEGYQLALLARSKNLITDIAKKLSDAHAYECDVSNADSIKKTFQQIRNDLGDVDVLIYNAGSGSWGNIEEIKAEDFETSWRVNAFGLMLASQEVIPDMKKKAKGQIIIIGATASKRGNIKTAAFAPAKAAQRSLAESMARYLSPLGIHVAIIIIDGVVNLERTRKSMPDKPDDFFIKPRDVADTAFYLTQQPVTAQSFEVEIRPYAEKW
jgi:NAD(P)-dependent dehydrogenase (short-subunit alcohol dehydrogenase family)